MKAGATIRVAGRILFGLILVVIGSALAIGGTRLIMLGGSLYYLPAGLATFAAGGAVLAGKWRAGGRIYAGLFAVTLVWALAEAGLDGWALMPRLLSPFVLGLPFLVLAVVSGSTRERLVGLGAFAVALVLAAAVGSTGFVAAARTIPARALLATDDAGNWPHFGRTAQGRHFSSLAQIDRGNVGRLEVAWSTLLGPMPGTPLSQNQTEPLKIGDHLYICTAFNDILDLDPDTGKTRWTFSAAPDVSGHYITKCRGVAYFAAPEARGRCAARIYTATTDARLIALDAVDGRPCEGFGAGGSVDLARHIAQRNPGYYAMSSAPTVVRGRIVVGSVVADGQYAGEPSGVVRAFDAITGELAWAWDVDRPDERGAPTSGGAFSSGTPNAWGPISADEGLGMVYVPTGNATPDYYGGHRSEASNRFASSVVALDAATGALRWHFQTTHYDVWDYDVASQPVLFDLHKDGKVIPALLQPTKRGQTFVLDRRTGEPIYPVVERPAPQAGSVEKLSPTQPWSPALPDFGGPRLTEAAMWGITALDQMWCRIKFREARYDGPLTPPGLTPSIVSPGYIGGTNWGSFSIDPARQLGFTLSSRLANHIRLIPRGSPEAEGLKASSTANLGGTVAQEGTPYAAQISPFLSPLRVPCQKPPHGLVNAIDLTTGKMVWSRPMGTARDLGPMGVRSRLPFTIGTPLSGGTMATATGLVFVGGSRDHAFHAFDSETGSLLFEADLPGNSATRPMTYRSDRSGRQFVVVASEAPKRNGKVYGAITAFALPLR